MLKDANACIYCGEEVGNKSTSLNMNTIEFSETKNSRNFKANFTDTVGESISSSFGILLANKIATKKPSLPQSSSMFLNNNPELNATPDLEDIEDAIIVSPEINQLKQIFKVDGDKTTLSETRLKANSKLDYGKRLAIIFLYYKALLGTENVPRKELTASVENASVEDGNFRHWLANNPLIGISGDMVEIKAPGKDAAKNI